MIEPYKSEIQAGIGDVVAKGSVSFASAITAPRVEMSKDDVILKFNMTKAAEANPNQLDLYYKHSILASVGWNKNDDVFDKIDTWNARHSVADKQLNLRHDELNIVGHMTDSLVFDAQGNIIIDSTPVDNLPDRFDVVSEWVLYRFWEDENRREEIEKIIAEIEQGKWFVSMECRFPQFDYAVIDLDGTNKTVARNENTAFLSQHLKAFGGTGEYQGRRIGRLLKGFFFTGQGIVENPANERSVIFNLDEFIPFKSQGSLTIREKTMDNEKVIAELTSQLQAVQAKLAETEAAAKKKMDEEMNEKMEKSKCEVAEAVSAKEKAEAELATAKAEVDAKNKVIAELTEEVKTTAEKLSVLETEIEATKAEAKTKARAAQLSGLVDASEVDKVVAKWSSLSDEQYADIVAMYQAKKSTASTTTTETVKEVVLEEAKAEANAALNQSTASTNDRVSALASLLSAGLPFSAKANVRLNK